MRYSLTFSEIDNLFKLINGYEFFDQVDSVIPQYLEFYTSMLEKNRYKNNVTIIQENSERIRNLLNDNSDQLEVFFNQIKDTYNIIIGLSNRLDGYKELIQNISSKEQLKEIVDGLLDFKNQIALSLKLSIPSNDVISVVKKIFTELKVDIYFQSNINNQLLKKLTYIIDNISSFVKLFEKSVQYLENINYEKYNIELMMDYYLSSDFDGLNNELNKFVDEYKKVLKKVSLFDNSTYDEFEQNLTFILSLNCSDFSTFINVLFGVIGADVLVKEYYEDYNSMIDINSNIEFHNILSYLVKNKIHTSDISYNDFCGVASIAEVYIGSLNASKFYSTNSFAVAIYNSIYEYDKSKDVSRDFKLIREGISIFKDFYSIYFHNAIIVDLAESNEILNNEFYRECFIELKNHLNNEDIMRYVKFFEDFDDVEEKIEILSSDYLEKLDSVIELLCSDSLTKEEVVFINQIGKVFGINYK